VCVCERESPVESSRVRLVTRAPECRLAERTIGAEAQGGGSVKGGPLQGTARHLDAPRFGEPLNRSTCSGAPSLKRPRPHCAGPSLASGLLYCYVVGASKPEGNGGGPSRKASYDTKLQTVRGYVKQIKLCTQDQSLRHTRSRGGAAIISIFSLLYRVKIKGAAAATFRAGWACRDQTNGTVPFWERPLTTTT